MTQNQFQVGQTVLIRCHDEGFAGKTGEIVAVFSSGRCQVAVGPINVLNLPTEALVRSLADVIDQMVAIEPTLKSHLQSIRDSAVFSAPECQRRLWATTAEILTAVVPGREDIAAVFSGQQVVA